MLTLVWLSALAAPGASRHVHAQDAGHPVTRAAVESALEPERADGRIAFSVGTAAEPVTVDGRLDDPAWATALRIPLPFEVSPAENGEAPVATECMLTHDERNLYLACVAHDTAPNDVRAYIVDRDAIDGHDRIVLTLDTFNDQRRAFQFGVSALGVQSDAVVAQQGSGDPNQAPDALPVDPSWDAIWSSSGRLTPEGYVIEAAIPFRSLRFPTEAHPDGWGVYLTRWWPRRSNVEIRSAAWDRGNSCLLCQANLVTGIEGVLPGSNLQLTPTLTGSRTDAREDAPGSVLQAGPTTGDLGADVQWGLTSNLTLNATYNPDFSQVEADVAQLDVNNRFALFFPEKRPFFLEGADFFGTPLNAVFTRSVSDPIAGAKLTGKVGANALGALIVQDRTNQLLLPGAQSSSSTSLEDEVTSAVLRFRRDVGGTSTVGAMYTGRESSGYHNRVGGIDGFYRPTSSVTLQGQYLRSETAYPVDVADEFSQPLGGFSGDALLGIGRWATNTWALQADARVVDPDFRADAGFLTQAGVRGASANLQRRWWGDSDSWYSQIRLTSGFWRNSDFVGNQLNGGIWFGLEYQGPGQTRVGIWPNLYMKEHFEGVTYRNMNQVWFDVRTAPSGVWSFGLNGNVGDAIDFANSRVGSELRLAPIVDVRIGRNIELRLQHTFQRLRNDGARVFTANLTQARTVYNFSPRSFVRAVVQFRRTDREISQYVDADVDRRSRGLFGQLLYAYKVNPQTVLFLGYSQDGSGAVDAAQTRVPLLTRGRTFFLKLGYAWRP